VREGDRVTTTVSTLTFLEATYSQDAAPALATRIVLKRPLHEEGPAAEAFDREVEFYSRLAPELRSPPAAPCLVAGPSLILEDLRATHTNRPWPLPPSRAESQLAVEALAEVHATWWEAPSLGTSVGSHHTAESLTTMVAGIAARLPGFCDAVGDALSAERRETMERVFGSRLRPWLRLLEPRALTVTHGDAHGWNFLFPREAGTAAYLVDWQLWHVDVGARDLAFLMALHWYPERRRALEIPLLRAYGERLAARGVDDYSWEDLWLDYRLGCVRNLTIPILFWSRGMPPEAWWHRLECALVAYDDLRCDEVL
jgi:hypothetical protein